MDLCCFAGARREGLRNITVDDRLPEKKKRAARGSPLIVLSVFTAGPGFEAAAIARARIEPQALNALAPNKLARNAWEQNTPA